MKPKKPAPEPTKTDGPFPTAREVYARIQWDPRLDANRFVIGIDQHARGITELSFTAFVPNGDIPWHRVVYFRDDRNTVWDRHERRHRLDDLASSAPAPADAVSSGFFEALPVVRYDRAAREWVTDAPSPPASAVPAALTVVTWNVLSDTHDAHLTDTPRRIPALVASLRAADADVIALQEVTPTFLRALLDDEHVRDHYAVSDGPDARTLDPDGTVLLTRLPVRGFGVHRFSRHKRFVQAVIDLGGHTLHVVALHLTSDRAPNAEQTRARQMSAVLTRGVARGNPLERPATIVLGDFNLRDEGPPLPFAQAGFADAWTRARPDDPGYTFDPAENRLASLLTTSRQPARFDRVFTRDGALALQVRAVERVGTSPVTTTPEALHASDHYGVRCTFAVVGERAAATAAPVVRTVDVAPTHHSALVVIPPTELWEPIQRIRRAHDRSYERWMPHVNLVYGFVPDAHFEQSAQALEHALANVTSFEVTLDRFDRFEHPGSTVVWLRPRDEPEGSLKALQSAVEALFPQCNEQGAKSPSGFTAHLTVGRFTRNDPAANATVDAWQRDWKPLRFTVDAVHLISRRGDEPFVVRRSVRLGGRSLTFAEQLDALCRDSTCVTAEEAARVVHVVGSHRMGLATPESDTDLLVIGPSEVSTEALFGDLSRALTSRPGVREVRVAADAKVPVLRVESDEGSFDLFHARMPEGEAMRMPEDIPQNVVNRMDPASQRAVNAYAEASFIAEAIARTMDPSRFRKLVLDVRAWAKARGVHGNAFGYPGGITWTLLTLWSCQRHPSPGGAPHEALRAHFFEALDAHDWSEAITVRDDVPVPDETKHDRLRVMTPSAPSHNSARNLTRSTAAVLREEVRRARRVLARDPGAWAEAAEALGRLDDASITITARASNARELRAVTGWLEGRMVTVILTLEREAKVSARPVPAWERGVADEGVSHVRVWLRGAPARDPAEVVRAVLRDAMEAWGERPAGARVDVG